MLLLIIDKLCSAQIYLPPQFNDEYEYARDPQGFEKKLRTSRSKKHFADLDVQSVLNFAKFSNYANNILNADSARQLIHVCLTIF